MSAYSNIKRTITRFENKNGLNLMNAKFFDGVIHASLKDLIQWFKRDGLHPVYSKGFSVRYSPDKSEIWVMKDNKALYWTKVENISRKPLKVDWFDDFPNWAIPFFYNDDSSGLSEEDIKDATEWYERKYKALESEGFYGLDFYFGDDTGFHHYPAFGLACDCVHCEIYGYKRL